MAPAHNCVRPHQSKSNGMAKIHVSFIANACNRATGAAVHFGGRQRRNARCEHESSFGYSKTKTSGVNSASKFERWAICIFSSRDLMLRAGRVSNVCGGVVVIAHCPSPIILLLLLAAAAAATCSVIRKFQKCQSHIDTLFIHNTYLFINGDMFGGLIRGFKITNKVVGFAYYVILFTKLHVEVLPRSMRHPPTPYVNHTQFRARKVAVRTGEWNCWRVYANNLLITNRFMSGVGVVGGDR